MREATGNVLVTGAGGFIGSELCRQLAATDANLVMLTRSAASGTPLPGSDSRHVTGDIRDPEVIRSAVDGVEVIYHLAGIAHVDTGDSRKMTEVTVAATRALAQAAAAAKVRRIVYFSSSLAVAAERGESRATAYGRAKYAAEQALFEVARESSIEVTVLRPVNVYGHGMKGNLAAMIRLIRRGWLPPLPHQTTRLSLVGVEDLCRAALIAGERQVASGKTYVVTDGLEYRLSEIEVGIYRALGKPDPHWRTPRLVFLAGAMLAGVRNRLRGDGAGPGLRTYRNLMTDSVFSNWQICDELNFKPQQSFYTALPSLID